MTMQDTRRVVLIKSLATNNRFYALVEPERGIRNADMIQNIPEDLLLGIAYPCLEDGLNDFAVIRTTFETLDLFPTDDPIRDEMMEIVTETRGNLLKRLRELSDRLRQSKAHFLGTDYNEFKGYALDMVNRGYIRRNLDSMMKLNVFTSVAEAEGYADSHDLNYYYEFAPGTDAAAVSELPARAFIVALFDDLIASVLDDANYESKYKFDRNVFQKFIAVMFVNYATTDPMFYGINRNDYGVSGEKEMDNTPLYIAIRREMIEIASRLASDSRDFTGGSNTTTGSNGHLPVSNGHSAQPALTGFSPLASEPDFTSAPVLPGSDLATALSAATPQRLSPEQVANRLPSELVNEEVLLGPITSLCSAASLLMNKNDPETQRFARVIMADASKLIDELKRLGIVSPLVNNPGMCG